MKDTVTITKKEFDIKFVELIARNIDYISENISPDATSFLIGKFRNLIFGDDDFQEDEPLKQEKKEKQENHEEKGMHSIMSADGNHASITVMAPKGINWNDVPDELKRTIHDLTDNLLAGGDGKDDTKRN